MQFIIPKTTKTRLAFFLLMDMFFVAISFVVSYWIKFDGKISAENFSSMAKMIVLTCIILAPIFYIRKLYSFSWSYVSTGELISLFTATSISYVILIITAYVLNGYVDFSFAVILVSYLLVLLLSGGIRLAKRVYVEFFRKSNNKEAEKLLIVGAGDAGEQILRSIVSSGEDVYFPLGFIDDNPKKKGMVIHGLKILGTINDIPRIVREYAVEVLIIALPSAGVDAIKDAVELGRKAGLKKIKIVPSISEIVDGQVSIKDTHEVQVEDLLGRKKISLDTEKIEKLITGKIVLITGAAGSIGAELSRQTARFKPASLLILDQDETGLFNISEELKYDLPHLNIVRIVADITDENKIREVFNKFKPNIVFHAAAYKHVPLMEEYPDEAVKNNIFGTSSVAKASIDSGVEKFILISTDKAVNPTSIMGVAKRIGEMICQASNKKNKTKFISVRFGNVLNSRGSVIPIFREQIRRGGPVQVTHPEMKRYFMLISEACLLVMQAGAMGEGGEVFVLDMGSPIKIIDLAKEMIRLSGFEPDKDIAIVFTEPRPGEKLFEEILTAEEGTVATQNQKIFMAKLSDVDPVIMDKNIDDLKSVMIKGERDEIINTLKKIVPQYKKRPNDHSV